MEYLFYFLFNIKINILLNYFYLNINIVIKQNFWKKFLKKKVL